MESTTEARSVVREITIEASPTTVWEFLVDPDKATCWWGPTLSYDARPGRAYRIEVIPAHIASGTFVELDAPRRLVYTWGWEPGEDGTANPVPPGSSTVEGRASPEWRRNPPPLHPP